MLHQKVLSSNLDNRESNVIFSPSSNLKDAFNFPSSPKRTVNAEINKIPSNSFAEKSKRILILIVLSKYVFIPIRNILLDFFIVPVQR